MKLIVRILAYTVFLMSAIAVSPLFARCVSFVNHANSDATIALDVLGDVAQGSVIGLKEGATKSSDTMLPGQKWGVALNFDDVNMKKLDGPLGDFQVVFSGGRPIGITNLKAINSFLRAGTGTPECWPGDASELFSVALFSDNVLSGTAELHDQTAIVKRWYDTPFHAGGIRVAVPKAERLARVRGWFRKAPKVDSAASDFTVLEQQGQLEATISQVSSQASKVINPLSDKDQAKHLYKAVVNQTTALFADKMFEQIDQAGLDGWRKIGHDLLAYISKNGSRKEFFGLYWPLFYAFRTSANAFKAALGAKTGNVAQSQQLLQKIANDGLFTASRQQLQRMLAQHSTVQKLSKTQALALVVASYLEVNLKRQEAQVSSFVQAAPMASIQIEPAVPVKSDKAVAVEKGEDGEISLDEWEMVEQPEGKVPDQQQKKAVTVDDEKVTNGEDVSLDEWEVVEQPEGQISDQSDQKEDAAVSNDQKVSSDDLKVAVPEENSQQGKGAEQEQSPDFEDWELVEAGN